MRPHRPTGGSSYMWWEEGGGEWSHVPSPGLRLGAGRNPATISEETSSKPTFPARACARAPDTARRRSPKGHRPDLCLGLPLALLPGAGDSVGRLQAFTGSVGDLSSSPSSGCPWRLHSISRSQVEEFDLGSGCAGAPVDELVWRLSSSEGCQGACPLVRPLVVASAILAAARLLFGEKDSFWTLL
jgi:hypothetical protein